MLRGQLTSVELYRGLISPLFRRNITVAAVRYADDKDTNKVEGIFSWLKDALRPDSRTDEAVRGASSPEKHEINNSKLEDITDQDFDDVDRSFKSPKVDETSTATLRNPVNHHDISISNPKVDEKTDKNVDTSLSHTYRSSFLNYDPLTLAENVRTQIRTIVSCAPRRTKPPIREPNMPEQQQKKDDKKDKKKKKPVIRMESGMSENCQNEVTAECRNDLYDNLDVNFQWGIRLPEELEKEQQLELKQDWEVGLKRMGNSLAADTNYSSYQVSSSQAMDAIRAIRDLQMTMSSTKNPDKDVDATGDTRGEKLDKAMEKTSPVASKEAKEVTSIESLKKILKTSPIVMKETSVVDEDYNVPTNANFDAELAAWKDLVLKSKVPLDPTKEEFIGTDTARRAEMLSIRPEPPQPKLDVQAVPTVDDSMKDEEEEVEFSREVKSNTTSMDVRRTSSPSDIQKMDSKKLHTGPICCLRRHGRLRLNSPWILDSLESDATIVASDFSTSTDGGWSGTERTPADGASGAAKEPAETDPQSNVASNQEMERSSDANLENASSNETTQEQRQEQREQTVNFEQQEEPKLEAEFANTLNTIPEREIEISLTRMPQENQDILDNSLLTPTQRDLRKFETDEHVIPLPDDIHMNSDFVNAYEDDFYPSYESIGMEHSEKPPSDQDPESLAGEQQPRIDEDRKLFAGQVLNTTEYTIDSNYIKVPGDPYPYSKEHFNKWRMSHEQIHIGPIKELEQRDILNTPINSPTPPARRVEIQQPVRKMSLDSHIRETPDDLQH